MKNSQKFAIGCLIVLVVVVGAGIYGFVKVRGVYKEVKGAAVGGEIAGPNEANWDKLKEGMSREEVQTLLGDGVWVTSGEEGNQTTSLVYTHSGGLGMPTWKSHVLEFENNKLVKWRKPLKEDPDKAEKDSSPPEEGSDTPADQP